MTGNFITHQVEDQNGYLRSTAILSTDLNYRYVLERVWDEDLPMLMWVMLNPSTADGTKDDPTIRRCVGFAKTYGMGSIRVLNLYALRATDPAELAKVSLEERVGPENDILLAADLYAMNDRAGLVIAAWGTKAEPERVDWYREHSYGSWCLGFNADGSPKHPLYVPSATALSAWPELSSQSEIALV